MAFTISMGYTSKYVVTAVADDSSYVELTLTVSGVQNAEVNPSVKVGGWVYITGTGIASLDKKVHQIREVSASTTIVLETAYVSSDTGLTAELALNPRHVEIDI